MRELYCFIIFFYVLVEYEVISSLGYLQNNSRLCYVYHFQIVTCASHEGIFWCFFLSHDMKLHKKLIIMSRQILCLLIFGKNVIFMRWRPWIIFLYISTVHTCASWFISLNFHVVELHDMFIHNLFLEFFGLID